MSYPIIKDGTVTRNGFQSSHGRFTACWGIARFDSASLREIFLPELPNDADWLKFIDHTFVRAQLHHYGITDAGESTGESAEHELKLLKTALKLGKCDAVPAHIAALEAEMHEEWLATQSPRTLAKHPQWAMRFFVDPDGSRHWSTTHVVAFPFGRRDRDCIPPLCAAAAAVPGLHHATGQGRKPKVFVGWDMVAVDQAAKDHTANEDAAMAAAARVRLRRVARLAAAAARTPAAVVGKYVVECPAITDVWRGAGHMTMSISTTEERGLYQADFDFGMLTGVMLLNVDGYRLCEIQEDDDEDVGDNEHEDDEEAYDDEEYNEEYGGDDDDELTAYLERVVCKGDPNSQQPSGTASPTHTEATTDVEPNPEKYYLLLRSRHTATGEITSVPRLGWILCPSATYTTFKGVANLPDLGLTEFTARKVGRIPAPSRRKWSDYSWWEYENWRLSPA
ncbi:uncharacterized protein COLE_05357 [Cutaneotrichosporon oleaginosum]|uniref:uncharacterized protein n=1 Tax=Cutaneotrichosporon oleaginosum TaxID=879819 RepID=UPI00132BC690|nr:hypothetical protein COLE_05357 [Cutaneotrichosporon oleaginosum]